VTVRIDESGHHDHAARVDDLRMLSGDARAYGLDFAVFHQHVAPCEVPQRGIQRQHGAILDQHAARPAVATVRLRRAWQG
jgi:hypothetical protein